MLRIAWIVISGVPHHNTQRGNNKQDVFFVDEDRIIFLRHLPVHLLSNRQAVRDR